MGKIFVFLLEGCRFTFDSVFSEIVVLELQLSIGATDTSVELGLLRLIGYVSLLQIFI